MISFSFWMSQVRTLANYVFTLFIPGLTHITQQTLRLLVALSQWWCTSQPPHVHQWLILQQFCPQNAQKAYTCRECTSGKLSSLRLFMQLNIFIYCNVSRNSSGFQYVLSKVNHNLSTCLYFSWAEPSGMQGCDALAPQWPLWHVASYKCLLIKPPSPPIL